MPVFPLKQPFSANLGGLMKTAKLAGLCLVVVFFTSGCVVTRSAYDELLREKAAADIERQKLEKDLSEVKAEKDKKIAELNSNIASLKQAIKALRARHESDMKLAKEKNEELAEGLQALLEQSSQDKKILMNRIEELSGKYKACTKAMKGQIDAARDRGETVILDRKRTVEGLFDQLEKQLQEQIKRGEIKLKRYRANTK